LKAAGALATNQIKRAKRANLAWPEHSEGNPSRSAINFQIRPHLIYLPWFAITPNGTRGMRTPSVAKRRNRV
jgi:hypothetical protein